MAAYDERSLITWKENSITMMKEASALGILPPQREALKWWGFYGLKAEDMFELWRIYMLLLHRHRYQVEVLAEWCSKSELTRRAIEQFDGRRTHEGRWLTMHGSKLQPSCEKWPLLDVSEKWYECARLCFDSEDIKQIVDVDNTLLKKRKGYLAYGAFMLSDSMVPRYPEYIENIWHELEINTQGNNKWWIFLRGAITTNSDRVVTDRETALHFAFEEFWERCNLKTLVSWANTCAASVTGVNS